LAGALLHLVLEFQHPLLREKDVSSNIFAHKMRDHTA
jgi:hypothetical protein